MKKRIIALVCALAIILSSGAFGPKVSAAGGSFLVGWERVDINPWDPQNPGQLLRVPLQGGANAITRQSATRLIDDNGDGSIGQGDGLFATCLAVTGTNGQTVLLYTVSIITGKDRVLQAVRSAVSEKLGIPAENIMLQGTHTHNSVDLSSYDQDYKGSEKLLEYMLDQNGKRIDATMTYGQVYENLHIYYNDILIPRLVAAAEAAVKDQAAATMKKGQIDAGDTAARLAGVESRRMNAVRHYLQAKDTAEIYVSGANFNTNNIPTDGSGVHALAAADDTMYCLEFDFGGSKAPIALVNWRAHATQNNRNGTKLSISADYVNRMSQVLQDNGYRSVFIQGAAGNINPTGNVQSAADGWCDSSKHVIKVDKNGDVTAESTLTGNIYGEVLGQVAVECLTGSGMKSVDAGQVEVTSLEYHADHKTVGDTIEYYAGVAEYYARKAGISIKYPFVYPQDVDQDIYNAMDTDKYARRSKTYYDSLTGQTTYAPVEDPAESFAVASQYQGDDIWANHNKTGKKTLALSAFMLGSQVAFVTAPGELYDRYSSQASWQDMQALQTKSEMYNYLTGGVNEWDKLVSSSYGTPFVMGYANGDVGYIPNKVAYEYNAGYSFAAVGAYEAHVTDLQKGTGEQLMDVYASMLDELNGTVDEDSLYHRSAWCEACRETVVWTGVSESYNRITDMAPGHYYLLGDVSCADGKLSSKVCLDMNGHNIICANSYTLDAGGRLQLQGSGSFRNATSGTVALTVKDGAKLTLSGGVNLRVKFEGDSADAFTVKGPYSGQVYITTAAAYTNSMQDVGNISGAVTGKIFTTNIYSAAICQGDLVLMEKSKAAILRKKDGSMTNMTAAEAVAAYKAGDTLILVGAVDSAVTIGRNMTVDLNGQSFAPTVSKGKLTLLDSRTADYEENEQDFAKVSAQLASQAKAAAGYLKFTHEDGQVSFHRVDTQLESVSCRPARAGIYYGAVFLGDQYVARMVDSFGVALSTMATPVNTTGFSSFSQYSAFDAQLFEAGNREEYTSTILVDILSEKNDTQTNLENGETKVRGRSYIKLKDGTFICGTEYQVDLRMVVEYVNDTWDTWDDATQKAVLALYRRFEDVLGAWETDAITKAYRESK